MVVVYKESVCKECHTLEHDQYNLLARSIVKVKCLDYYDSYLINYSLFVGYGDLTGYSIKNLGSFSKLDFPLEFYRNAQE